MSDTRQERKALHRALVMRPGEPLTEFQLAPGVEAMQAVVGGYSIHVWPHILPLPATICAIMREYDWEGQAQKLGVAPNAEMNLGNCAMVYGPMLFVGTDATGETVDLTDEQVKTVGDAVARHLTRRTA